MHKKFIFDLIKNKKKEKNNNNNSFRYIKKYSFIITSNFRIEFYFFNL